ncbi:peptidoglycan DD-metalloendopeptidase family protein [Mucilaginibacter sp. CAU 1740]|uniref:peptidoglycan DD-metalloendopeptidase family protein n=1 Tax=Mucilaginibacter sp. CAU 1740 TaxID=3140365 RepID=UPI00325AEA5C
MDKHKLLANYVNNHPEAIGKVVDFDAANDRLFQLDLTAANKELTVELINNTGLFSQWVNDKLRDNNCHYGIGGYMEHRTIYAFSSHFDTEDEPRRLHLGVDIWGNAGTTIYAPLDGIVHSYQNNNHLGDYGPTIILQHNLDGLELYSLYGHLSRESLSGLYVGMPISRDQQIATLGDIEENGNWPPHLHFQLMFDMEGKKGDYPGVCKFSEKEIWQRNIPDPGLILRFPDAVNAGAVSA